jgi:hypothetical protein
MKVIKPVALTSAMLISSTVAETEYAAYAAATNYAVGTRTIYLSAVYESVQTPNTGHAPDVSPLYWAKVGPSNRWAMFDAEVNTQTVATTSMTVVLKPGLCNSLVLFNLVGAALVITVRDGLAGPVLYTKAVNLDGSVVVDWYQYFFEPIAQLTSVVLTDLPAYGNAHITITITGSTVMCGHVALGSVYGLGDTEYGVNFGITDYSRKETTATGTTTLVKRKFARKLSASLTVKKDQVTKVNQTLENLRATPCAWIATDAPGYEPLTIFGFYSNFSITVQYATRSLCSLEIQGLV